MRSRAAAGSVGSQEEQGMARCRVSPSGFETDAAVCGSAGPSFGLPPQRKPQGPDAPAQKEDKESVS